MWIIICTVLLLRLNLTKTLCRNRRVAKRFTDSLTVSSALELQNGTIPLTFSPVATHFPQEDANSLSPDSYSYLAHWDHKWFYTTSSFKVMFVDFSFLPNDASHGLSGLSFPLNLCIHHLTTTRDFRNKLDPLGLSNQSITCGRRQQRKCTQPLKVT